MQGQTVHMPSFCDACDKEGQAQNIRRAWAKDLRNAAQDLQITALGSRRDIGGAAQHTGHGWCLPTYLAASTLLQPVATVVPRTARQVPSIPSDAMLLLPIPGRSVSPQLPVRQDAMHCVPTCSSQLRAHACACITMALLRDIVKCSAVLPCLNANSSLWKRCAPAAQVQHAGTIL